MLAADKWREFALLVFEVRDLDGPVAPGEKATAPLDTPEQARGRLRLLSHPPDTQMGTRRGPGWG